MLKTMEMEYCNLRIFQTAEKLFSWTWTVIHLGFLKDFFGLIVLSHIIKMTFKPQYLSVDVFTSTGVLLTGASVLTWVLVAGSCPAAALVHPKHPSAPWPSPLRRVTKSDWLPVELQALQTADKIRCMPVDLCRRTLSERRKEQSTVGTHQTTRLGQNSGGRVVLVQRQLQGGRIDFQQNIVPAAVCHRSGRCEQWSRCGVSTAISKVQLPVGQLRTGEKRWKVNDAQIS